MKTKGRQKKKNGYKIDDLVAVMRSSQEFKINKEGQNPLDTSMSLLDNYDDRNGVVRLGKLAQNEMNHFINSQSMLMLDADTSHKEKAKEPSTDFVFRQSQPVMRKSTSILRKFKSTGGNNSQTTKETLLQRPKTSTIKSSERKVLQSSSKNVSCLLMPRSASRQSRMTSGGAILESDRPLLAHHNSSCLGVPADN